MQRQKLVGDQYLNKIIYFQVLTIQKFLIENQDHSHLKIPTHLGALLTARQIFLEPVGAKLHFALNYCLTYLGQPILLRRTDLTRPLLQGVALFPAENRL